MGLAAREGRVEDPRCPWLPASCDPVPHRSLTADVTSKGLSKNFLGTAEFDVVQHRGLYESRRELVEKIKRLTSKRVVTRGSRLTDPRLRPQNSSPLRKTPTSSSQHPWLGRVERTEGGPGTPTVSWKTQPFPNRLERPLGGPNVRPSGSSPTTVRHTRGALTSSVGRNGEGRGRPTPVRALKDVDVTVHRGAGTRPETTVLL